MLMSILSGAVVAQSQPAKDALAVTNGCGTGWNTWLVPDSIPLAACQFKQACDAHDVCYGRCEGRAADTKAPECAYLACVDAGELFETFRCESDARLLRLKTLAEIRKKACDDDLYKKIRALNPKKAVCAAFAVVYRAAVKKWGKGAFRGLDPSGRMLNQPRAKYDAAIREFFRLGTQEEFEHLARSFDEDKPSVDLAKPIAYDSDAGLHNISE